MTRQEEFNANHIKVAYVSRDAQYALNLIILGNNGIYMTMQQVDDLAKQYPESYLKSLEWIREIILKADFVGKYEEGHRIVYVKRFYNDLTKKFYDAVVSAKKNTDHWDIEWWYSTTDSDIIIRDTKVDKFVRLERGKRQ